MPDTSVPHSSMPGPPRDVRDYLTLSPVVPVLTISRAEDAVPLARALIAGGLSVLEVTLRTPAALDAIRRISDEVPEAVVAAVSVAVPGVGFAVETGVMVVFEPGFTRPNHGGDLRLAAADLAELWHHGTPIVKLLAWSATCTADHLLTLVRTAAGEAVECTHSGGTGLVEVSAAGVSKLAALIDLCAEREVPAAQVVAFGDMPNDLAMLTWAGRGYAVANAHPSVLAAGLPTTASNDDDGVARILESLLDGSFPGHG